MNKIIFESDNMSCSFKVSSEIYPLTVILKTAYSFINNYYLFLDPSENNQVLIQIRTKQGSYCASWEKFVGEFYNELLNQNIHYNVQKETQELRQLILGRALYEECLEINTGTTTMDTLSPEGENSRNTSGKNEIALAQEWCEDMRFHHGK